MINVDETGELGSYVGNSVDGYQQMKIIVYLTSSFVATIVDHLGQTIQVSAKKKQGNSDVSIAGIEQKYSIESVEG